MLNKRGIPHKVLNAKFHELEAEIVAQARVYMVRLLSQPTWLDVVPILSWMMSRRLQAV